MTDLFDRLCQEIRLWLWKARDPEVFGDPRDIVLTPGRRDFTVVTPSAITMVLSRRTDPGTFAAQWLKRAQGVLEEFTGSASRTGYIEIEVSHARVAALLDQEDWPRKPLDACVREPEDPMFFAYFFRRRLASLLLACAECREISDARNPQLDWHLLRGTHLLGHVRPAMIAEWAAQAKALFDVWIAGGGRPGEPVLRALDALLARAGELCADDFRR